MLLSKKIFIITIFFNICVASQDIEALPQLPAVIPILVIGSGPAGLMAGVYGARAKVPTYIFTGAEPGGQLLGAGEVENMPGVAVCSGEAIMGQLFKQAQSFGAYLIEDTIIQLDMSSWPFSVISKNSGECKALAIILATGAAPRKLGIPGEVEYWSAGVSACSICDCFLFKDKEVVIVGGGDAAVEHALNLIPYAKKITIFVRKDRMRAASQRQDLMNHEKVTIIYNKQILEVLGDGEKVTGLVIEDSIDKSQELVSCDGLFLAVGHNPNTSLVRDWLELSADGYVKLPTRSQQTTINGVFAAGDIADFRFRQAGIAAGAGIQAALEAIDFLRDHGIDDREIKKLTLFKK